MNAECSKSGREKERPALGPPPWLQPACKPEENNSLCFLMLPLLLILFLSQLNNLLLSLLLHKRMRGKKKQGRSRHAMAYGRIPMTS